MKVKISFTVDVDYEQWSEQRIAAGKEVSRSALKDNLQGLTEESFDHLMNDWVRFTWVDA